MQKILLASNNAGKIQETTEILAQVGYVAAGYKDAGFLVTFPPEKTTSYEENAAIKARTLYQATGEMVLGDDAGLTLAAFPDKFGVTTARDLGENLSPAEQNQKILTLLENETNRKATLHCALCFIDERGKEKIFSATCEGLITQKEVRAFGYGFDKIFYLPVLGKTLAALTDEERSLVSHRGKALRQLAKYLGK